MKALPETDVRIEEDKQRRQGRGGSLRFADADAAARGLPDAAGGQRNATRVAAASGGEGDGREDAIRDHRRGHAVFPQRREVRAEAGEPDARGDRRSPTGARRSRSTRRGVAQEVGVILPKKTLLELGKLLAEGEGDIQFEGGENHLFFEVGDRMLISRMIDGQFPAYERVIPKGNDKTSSSIASG